uniref:Putative secreted protein n=1 Tax=Ixodes ricinus TaxID=34613 RepID=A0A6B0U848_IXORI
MTLKPMAFSSFAFLGIVLALVRKRCTEIYLPQKTGSFLFSSFLSTLMSEIPLRSYGTNQGEPKVHRHGTHHLCALAVIDESDQVQ